MNAYCDRAVSERKQAIKHGRSCWELTYSLYLCILGPVYAGGTISFRWAADQWERYTHLPGNGGGRHNRGVSAANWRRSRKHKSSTIPILLLGRRQLILDSFFIQNTSISQTVVVGAVNIFFAIVQLCYFSCISKQKQTRKENKEYLCICWAINSQHLCPNVYKKRKQLLSSFKVNANNMDFFSNLTIFYY